jgi:hypothetical protein
MTVQFCQPADPCVFASSRGLQRRRLAVSRQLPSERAKASNTRDRCAVNPNFDWVNAQDSGRQRASRAGLAALGVGDPCRRLTKQGPLLRFAGHRGTEHPSRRRASLRRRVSGQPLVECVPHCERHRPRQRLVRIARHSRKDDYPETLHRRDLNQP